MIVRTKKRFVSFTHNISMMENSLTIAALVLDIVTNILESTKSLFKYSFNFYNFKDMLSSRFEANTILFLLRT